MEMAFWYPHVLWYKESKDSKKYEKSLQYFAGIFHIKPSLFQKFLFSHPSDH